MLKKTTIYLDEKDLEKLKALSFVLNTSMTDLIRKGVQSLHDSISMQQRKTLENLATAKSGFSDKKSKKVALKSKRSK